MVDPSRRPEDFESELTAFGPGYGECLLVHLGLGEWLIVDSCIRAKRQPALEYLQAMHVDPATAVKLVVATHWHDDHVKGISEVVAACQSALFSCSVALHGDELIQGLGSVPPSRHGRLTSGVEEMQKVLDVEKGGRDTPPTWAIQERPLYRRRSPSPLTCSVLALAPSDRAVLEAYEGVVNRIAAGSPAGRVRPPDRNLGAVVLWVEVGEATMLLGSDLQEDPGGGWTAVLDCWTGMNRQSEIFKVPHHGSENGHLDDVWNRILIERPDAVVCPHHNGRNHLPTPPDLERLCGLAKVHLTSPGTQPEVYQKGRKTRPVGEFGRVTLRRDAVASVGAPWSVNYGGAADNACPSDDSGVKVVPLHIRV